MSLEINTDDFWKELYQPVLDARTERKLFIEEITKLREQVAAQAAVIEKLREALQFYSNTSHIEYLYGKRDWLADRADLESKGFRREGEDYNGGETFVERGWVAESALATPTDSTQILDEVRKQERERCAKVVEEGTALTAFQSKDCYSYACNRAAAIRAME